jgi:hypothetical protein
VVKIHVQFFWDVTPCGVVVGYHRFNQKMEAAYTSEKFVSYHITKRRRNQNLT